MALEYQFHNYLKLYREMIFNHFSFCLHTKSYIPVNSNGEIIYIGKAKNLKSRIHNHTHLPKECYEERKKIEFIEFNTEEDMDFAERYFIPRYKPKYNTIWSEKRLTLKIKDFDELKWTPYFETYDFEQENDLKDTLMYLFNLEYLNISDMEIITGVSRKEIKEYFKDLGLSINDKVHTRKMRIMFDCFGNIVSAFKTTQAISEYLNTNKLNIHYLKVENNSCFAENYIEKFSHKDFREEAKYGYSRNSNSAWYYGFYVENWDTIDYFIEFDKDKFLQTLNKVIQC